MGLLLASGALSGFLFDFYRILRTQGRRNRRSASLRWVTFCSDLIFSVLVLGILLFFFWKANFLEFRLYLFITSLIGLVLYLVLLSSRVKGVLVRFFFVTRCVGGTVTNWGRVSFRGIWKLCRLLLAIPYGILRWFGLLVYRFWEAVLRDFSQSVQNMKGKGRRRQGVPENQGKQEQKPTRRQEQRMRKRARKQARSQERSQAWKQVQKWRRTKRKK